MIISQIDRKKTYRARMRNAARIAFNWSAILSGLIALKRARYSISLQELYR